MPTFINTNMETTKTSIQCLKCGAPSRYLPHEMDGGCHYCGSPLNPKAALLEIGHANGDSVDVRPLYGIWPFS